MKKNIIILLIINIIFLSILFLEFIYLYTIENSYNLFFRKFLDFQILFILGFSIICGTALISFFQPYNLFLGTFFLFLGGRFFLDLFNLRDVMLMDRFIKFSLNGIEEIELYKIMIFSILFINLGFLFGNLYCKKNKKTKEYKILSIDLKLRKLYIFFYETFFILELYKKYFFNNFIHQNGYLNFYTKESNYPFFTKGSGTFLEINYILFLLTKPPKKTFLIISSQYVLIGFIEALSGPRSKFIVRIMFVLTYYFIEYQKKVNYKFLISILSFCIFFSQYINQVRLGLNFKLNNIFFSFIAQQGTSINVLGTIIKFKKILKERIKFSIISKNLEYGNTVFNGKNGTLAHKLSYFLSPEKYLNGEGIGGSFLGEIIAIDSTILFLFFTFLLGFLICIIFKKRRESVLKMGIYLIILPHIYYMSRDSYFFSVKYFFIYFLFVFVHSLIKKKGEKCIH